MHLPRYPFMHFANARLWAAGTRTYLLFMARGRAPPVLKVSLAARRNQLGRRRKTMDRHGDHSIGKGSHVLPTPIKKRRVWDLLFVLIGAAGCLADLRASTGSRNPNGRGIGILRHTGHARLNF